MEVRQEIYCHNCGGYVQFTFDNSLNGNHTIICPKCGHEHCRVIKNGEITGDRWDSRNGMTFLTYQVVYSPISFEINYDTSGSTAADSTFLCQSWSTTTIGVCS
jgi:DNA-directed RNA polymerase subunit RPC12/RpoP